MACFRKQHPFFSTVAGFGDDRPSSITNLMAEHQRILKTVGSFERFLVTLHNKGAFDATEAQDLEKYTTFIKEYADTLHHLKEENVLFPKMVEYGFNYGNGPLHCMLQEHTDGRAHVKAMLDALAAAQKTPEEQKKKELLGQIISAGQEYVSLIRQHIDKEDNVLYPMAIENVSQRGMEEVDEISERMQDEKKAELQAMEKLSDELVRKYGGGQHEA